MGCWNARSTQGECPQLLLGSDARTTSAPRCRDQARGQAGVAGCGCPPGPKGPRKPSLFLEPPETLEIHRGAAVVAARIPEAVVFLMPPETLETRRGAAVDAALAARKKRRLATSSALGSDAVLVAVKGQLGVSALRRRAGEFAAKRGSLVGQTGVGGAGCGRSRGGGAEAEIVARSRCELAKTYVETSDAGR